ncbi:TPA: hypothetical protein QC285_004073 [Bacillus cereus]|nr:hypothetical protein [Bacillus cereus]
MRKVVLTGNGLSVALNKALGITSISGFKYNDERILFGEANAAVDLIASHS